MEAKFPGKTITEVVEDGEDLVVKGIGFEEKVPAMQVKRQNCYTCVQRNPVIFDEMASEEEDASMGGNIDKVAAPWEKLEPAERWEKFQETIQDCIRCYACRDACPLCYCHVCFVDESKPQWCGKTQDEADVATFHLLRAFHCARARLHRLRGLRERLPHGHKDEDVYQQDRKGCAGAVRLPARHGPGVQAAHAGISARRSPGVHQIAAFWAQGIESYG